MTDPVSGQTAEQAVEQLRSEDNVVEQIDQADPTTDFSEMMASPEDDQADVEAIDESMNVDAPEQVDRVEEAGEIPTDDFVQKLLEEEQNIHEMMERCLDGQAMDQEEMLQMQAVIYGYSQRVDLTTKVVESATSGVEQVMNTQV